MRDSEDLMRTTSLSKMDAAIVLHAYNCLWSQWSKGHEGVVWEAAASLQRLLLNAGWDIEEDGAGGRILVDPYEETSSIGSHLGAVGEGSMPEEIGGRTVIG